MRPIHIFYCNSYDNPTKDGYYFDINYSTITPITAEEKYKYDQLLNDYVEQNKNRDIVEVVKDIRTLFAELEQYSLEVQIKNDEVSQSVVYKDDYIKSCFFIFEKWNDRVEVSETYKGLNIEYYKERTHARQDNIDEIMGEIKLYCSKIIELKEIAKEMREKSINKKESSVRVLK